MARASPTIKLPRDLVEELYDASIRFSRTLETLEVLLDKATVRRLKLGEKQYHRGQFVTAKNAGEIRNSFYAYS